MIKHFDNFSELTLTYAEVFSALTDTQCDMAPQVFNTLVDGVFNVYKKDVKLFLIENNYKHSFREAKRINSLLRKKWKKRLKDDFFKKHPDLCPSVKKEEEKRLKAEQKKLKEESKKKLQEERQKLKEEKKQLKK